MTTLPKTPKNPSVAIWAVCLFGHCPSWFPSPQSSNFSLILSSLDAEVGIIFTLREKQGRAVQTWAISPEAVPRAWAPLVVD